MVDRGQGAATHGCVYQTRFSVAKAQSGSTQVVRSYFCVCLSGSCTVFLGEALGLSKSPTKLMCVCMCGLCTRACVCTVACTHTCACVCTHVQHARLCVHTWDACTPVCMCGYVIVCTHGLCVHMHVHFPGLCMHVCVRTHGLCVHMRVHFPGLCAPTCVCTHMGCVCVHMEAGAGVWWSRGVGVSGPLSLFSQPSDMAEGVTPGVCVATRAEEAVMRHACASDVRSAPMTRTRSLAT